MIETVIFHYTPGSHLKSIIESGYLDVTPVPENLKPFERAIAWFSSNEDFYPPTACKPAIFAGKVIMMTPDLMHEMLGGVFRLAGSSKNMNCYPWQVLKHKAKLPKKLRKGLVSHAMKVGENPADWYGALERIPLHMLILQKWSGYEWVFVEMELASIDPIKMQIERKSVG